ncbi:MAG: beta-ketoacyl synthase N-terminal-like domain-containing protein [Acidimicrobiales bacterium]
MTDAERARVAVVDGLRTPFARRGGALSTLSAVDLGVACCAELIDRMSLDPERVDEVVYGQVILDVEAPNIAREVVLRTKLSAQTHAYSVSQACITGHRAVVCGVQAIRDGDARVVLAGGADSVSAAPLLASDRPTATLRRAERAEGPTERTKVLARLRARDHVPSVPDLTEPTRSETMGEAAERMAKMNHISRQAQDELAHRSHAWPPGRGSRAASPRR